MNKITPTKRLARVLSKALCLGRGTPYSLGMGMNDSWPKVLACIGAFTTAGAIVVALMAGANGCCAGICEVLLG